MSTTITRDSGLKARRRSDAELQQRVEEELTWTPNVDAADVGVSVVDGVVTLSGEVGTYVQYLAAKDAAFRVRGVLTLNDSMKVRPDSPADDPSDTELAAAVDHALHWTHDVPEDLVRAVVQDHRVTLSGEVDWQYQRAAAGHAVAQLRGVHSIENRIHLSARPSADDASERIRRALIRHATLDGSHIHVAVDGTTVVLTGKVRSFAERADAQHAAWASPHVTAVRNELVIVPVR